MTNRRKHTSVASLRDKLAHRYRDIAKETGICLHDFGISESNMLTWVERSWLHCCTSNFKLIWNTILLARVWKYNISQNGDRTLEATYVSCVGQFRFFVVRPPWIPFPLSWRTFFLYKRVIFEMWSLNVFGKLNSERVFGCTFDSDLIFLLGDNFPKVVV